MAQSGRVKRDSLEWPKLDQFQNRKICRACWHGIHRKCDGPCDCLHLSEKKFAAVERGTILANRKARAKLEKDALESPDNPLRAENDAFQPKHRAGKVHA
jgi:hypothetical protein